MNYVSTNLDDAAQYNLKMEEVPSDVYNEIALYMQPIDMAVLTFTCDAWSRLFSSILINRLPWHNPVPLDTISLDTVTWWTENIRAPFQDEIIDMAEKGCVSLMRYMEDNSIFWDWEECLIAAARGMNVEVVSLNKDVHSYICWCLVALPRNYARV